MTSAIVSGHRLASSTPLRLAHSPPPGPGRGHTPAGTRPGASGAGPPSQAPSPGGGGRAGCPRSRSRARRPGKRRSWMRTPISRWRLELPGWVGTASRARDPSGRYQQIPAIEARFQWPRWPRIGVCPWGPGAPHRRAQRTARLINKAPPPAPFQRPVDPGPLLDAPAGDLGLVTLAGPAGGSRRAPGQPAQQPPPGARGGSAPR
jgi:hypothetical protein